MIVDVHCHLQFPQFEKDLDEVISRAKASNVSAIICSGVDHQTNIKTLELSKKYNIVKASLGIYPLDAVDLGHKDDCTRQIEKIDVDGELRFIEKNKEKIVAIGEIGLDYSPEGDCKAQQQKEVFTKSIELAKKLKKPIVVHTRKAEKDCIDILESSGIKSVVLHCFSGNMKLVKRAEDLGFYFSIPTVITRLKHFQEIVGRISLNSILTETDAPYLSPYLGQRNEPAYIKETIKIISQIKKITEEETEKIIFFNYQKIFLKNEKRNLYK